MRPYPDKIVSSVFDITADFLREKGFRALLLDVDGTIAKTHSHALLSGVPEWVQNLKQRGVKVLLLSNRRRPGQVEPLAGQLSVPYIERAKKPRIHGFQRACALLDVPEGQTAAAGDKIYTDVWGARRAGVYAIFVSPADTRMPTLPIRKLIEKPFMKERHHV